MDAGCYANASFNARPLSSYTFDLRIFFEKKKNTFCRVRKKAKGVDDVILFLLSSHTSFHLFSLFHLLLHLTSHFVAPLSPQLLVLSSQLSPLSFEL